MLRIQASCNIVCSIISTNITLWCSSFTESRENVLIKIKMGIRWGRINYHSTNKKRKMREKDNRLCSKNISTKHLTYSPNDAAKPRGGREFPKCAKKRLLLSQHVSYLVYGSKLPMEGTLQASRNVNTLVNPKIQFPIQTERNTQRLS